jgi:hypothetical protein
MQDDLALASTSWHGRAYALAKAFTPSMLRHERIHAVGKAFKPKPASHLLARLAEAFQMRAASQIKALSQWFDVTLAVFGQYAAKTPHGGCESALGLGRRHMSQCAPPLALLPDRVSLL